MTDAIAPALTWRAVPGYEGLYEVSDTGQVRRMRGVDSLGRPRSMRVLRPSDDGRGYLVVSLSRDDRPRSVRVHTLVAAAWIGLRPEGRVVNHLDGDKHNNRRSNLEYCTGRENDHHAVIHGLKASGERHGSAKLSEADVAAMKRMHKDGRTYRAIADRFGVNETTASRAIRAQLWRVAA